MTDTNLVRFRAAVAGALAHLETRREEINDLNVFPVADGDTGDNMALTLRAVLDELDHLMGDGGRTIDEIGREEIVQSVARAALLGARGNSGVILSQLIRGAAEELVSRPGELIDPTLIGAALAHAADRAYASVRQPAEGTILTVAREMAHEIMTDVAHRRRTRASVPTPSPAAGHGHRSDARARRVRRSGVGQARTRAARGAARGRGGRRGGLCAHDHLRRRGGRPQRREPPPLEHHAPARITHPQHHSSTYRYCTNFAVTGSGLTAGRFIAALEEIGDSVLVVGDAATLKVHVHTDHPERAIAVFDGFGEVSRLDVADMRTQVAERRRASARRGDPGGDGAGGARAPPAQARCGALAVVSGDGVRDLFRSLGVHTIDGGPTLNPSTYELLAGIHEVPAEEVLVLPNSPNVIMAAERAAELSEKPVRVVPSTSQQAGLSAALALDPGRDLDENAAALGEALRRCARGRWPRRRATTPRAALPVERRSGSSRTRSWPGGRRATARCRACRARPRGKAISCLAGPDAPLDAAAVEELGPAGIELEYRTGGQPSYWWLLSAE